MSAVLQMPAPSNADRAVAAPHATWLQVLTDIHPRYGGVSAAVPELAAALAATGISASVAALCHADERYVPAQLSPEELHFLPRSRRAWVTGDASQEALQAVVRDSDGVHLHGLWTQASPAVASAARRGGKPYCVSAHGMLEPWSLQQHRLRKQVYAALVEHRVLRGAACLHALTESEARSYRAITRHVPVAIVPNGVAIPQNISAEPFLAAYPHLRGSRIVLFMSRLHHKKGVDILLRAWAKLHAQFADAHLVIAGSGEAGYTRQLQGLSAELGLDVDGSVSFTGLLQAELKWSALCAAECFVLPSHSEGFSMAVLEALGTGTPVIATPQCNMPELVTERCGWLAEPNESDLTATLQELLERYPAENGVVGRHGARLVQERYTWNAVAGRMAEVYRWLNGAARPTLSEVLA